MLGNKREVVRPEPLQFCGQCECEQHVGAGLQCQVQLGLLGDLCAQRVDDDEPAALALRFPDLANQMQVGDGRVVAPDDVERGVRRRLRPDAGHRAISAGPGLAAHGAAECAAIKLGGAQPMKKPQ